MSISNGPEKSRLAFLGPPGTYSHQAALECFRDSVDYVALPTIADVQRNLSAVMPFAIIPQENSINGSVVETYNILRVPVLGQETFVRGATVFAVNHALVARKGVTLEDIEQVLSHEQALGQCQEWLAKHLPRATLVHTDSTVKAAERLLSPEDGLDPMNCAAICSSVVVTLYEGLEVLGQHIQDGTENFTRFYILSQGSDTALPEGYRPSSERMALLRLGASLSDPAFNISRVISTLDLLVKRIDRRPSVHGRPFDDVYFLEVSTIPGQNSPESSWRKQLQQAIDRVRCTGVEVSALGYW